MLLWRFIIYSTNNYVAFAKFSGHEENTYVSVKSYTIVISAVWS